MKPADSKCIRRNSLKTLPDRDPFTFLEGAWRKSGNRDLISKASTSDLQTYLPCDLMTKVDIASMAHSLEARQPFLDYRLIEFAASLPVELKHRWRRGKRLLDDAFHDMIPSQIWTRPKMGFGMPVGPWFRGPLREKTEKALLGMILDATSTCAPKQSDRSLRIICRVAATKDIDCGIFCFWSYGCDVGAIDINRVLGTFDMPAIQYSRDLMTDASSLA